MSFSPLGEVKYRYRLAVEQLDRAEKLMLMLRKLNIAFELNSLRESLASLIRDLKFS